MTVDLSGRTRRIAKISTEAAWSPKGDEIWFNEIEDGTTSIYAMTLSGKRRLLASFPGDFALYDVSRDGRVLLSKESTDSEMIGGSAGQSVERNLSWLDGSVPADLSADGSLLLFSEVGMGGGRGNSVYKRGTDGSPAVRLGEGTASALSPDGKWALASQGPGPRVRSFSQRVRDSHGSCRWPGSPSSPATQASFQTAIASLCVGSRRVMGQGFMFWTSRRARPAPSGPKSLAAPSFGLSPDGKQLFCSRKGVGWELYDVEGGAEKAVPGLPKDSYPIKWCADGRCLFVQTTATLPIKVYRLTLSTGGLELWKEFSIPLLGSPTGLHILPAPDGKSYVYGYRSYPADLFIAEGLR